MTTTSKTKSHPNPFPFKIYTDLESILESVKSNERFYSKKYQSDTQIAKRLHTNNQQMCIDCLKPRSNKNDCVFKKCGCDYFYVPNY